MLFVHLGEHEPLLAAVGVDTAENGPLKALGSLLHEASPSLPPFLPPSPRADQRSSYGNVNIFSSRVMFNVNIVSIIENKSTIPDAGNASRYLRSPQLILRHFMHD